MNRTKIEYLDFTWSPLVGCSGKDCAVFAECWAKYQAKRRLHKCRSCYDFKPHSHFERLKQPLQVKTSKRIGVCFSADMWDKGFFRAQQETVVNIAARASQHWFINFTKQPQNIPPDMLFPNNWIQGVSVNLYDDLWRIETLKRTLAKILAVSFEPLYEDLGNVDLSHIDWVIIGNQTHPLIEASFDWIDNLVTLAQKFGIPVFIKNNVKGWNLKEFPTIFLKEQI